MPEKITDGAIVFAVAKTVLLVFLTILVFRDWNLTNGLLIMLLWRS